MAVDISTRGRRYRHLVVAYTDVSGRKVTCYCVCSRQVNVDAADLVAGVVTSCGCQPASFQYHERQAELRAQRQREITFNIALMRRGA